MPGPTEQELAALRNELMRNFEEEIVQEIIVRYWIAATAGKEIPNPHGWCAVACQRTRAKARRDFDRHPLLQMPEEDPISPFWHDRRSPEVIYEAKEQLDRVDQALFNEWVVCDESPLPSKLQKKLERERHRLKRELDPWPESSTEEECGG